MSPKFSTLLHAWYQNQTAAEPDTISLVVIWSCLTPQARRYV